MRACLFFFLRVLQQYLQPTLQATRRTRVRHPTEVPGWSSEHSRQTNPPQRWRLQHESRQLPQSAPSRSSVEPTSATRWLCYTNRLRSLLIASLYSCNNTLSGLLVHSYRSCFLLQLKFIPKCYHRMMKLVIFMIYKQLWSAIKVHVLKCSILLCSAPWFWRWHNQHGR